MPRAGAGDMMPAFRQPRQETLAPFIHRPGASSRLGKGNDRGNRIQMSAMWAAAGGRLPADGPEIQLHQVQRFGDGARSRVSAAFAMSGLRRPVRFSGILGGHDREMSEVRQLDSCAVDERRPTKRLRGLDFLGRLPAAGGLGLANDRLASLSEPLPSGRGASARCPAAFFLR